MRRLLARGQNGGACHCEEYATLIGKNRKVADGVIGAREQSAQAVVIHGEHRGPATPQRLGKIGLIERLTERLRRLHPGAVDDALGSGVERLQRLSVRGNRKRRGRHNQKHEKRRAHIFRFEEMPVP